MKIHLNNHQTSQKISKLYLKKKISDILKFLHLNQVEVSITLVGNDEIQKLNQQYRHKDYPTDVLSFPVHNQFNHLDDLLGDIVISTDKALSQSLENHLSLEEEIVRLVIHGVLHLKGYDHQTDEEYQVMYALESEIWSSLYPSRALPV